MDIYHKLRWDFSQTAVSGKRMTTAPWWNNWNKILKFADR